MFYFEQRLLRGRYEIVLQFLQNLNIPSFIREMILRCNEKNDLKYVCLWFDKMWIIEYIYITTDECIISANLGTTDGICVRGSQFFCGLNHFINIQQFLGFLLQVNQVLCRKILSSGTWHLSGSTWCHLCHFEVYI